MSYTIPSDAHSGGDSGHVIDHNNIADVLTSNGYFNPKNTAFAGGAQGNGVADDTAALTAWINAINASTTNGANAVIPNGHYLVSSSLPAITANGVTFTGGGYAQTNSNTGSVISSSATFSPLFTISGEGNVLQNLTLDGAGRSSTVLVINGPQAVCNNMQVRGVASGGVTMDIQTGGFSAWITDSVINGINGANTSIQVNDTDAIITGCKPKNGAFGIVLLSGATGALIANNHFTPGSGNGQNCIYLNGAAARISILGNRFDNCVFSPVQITPSANINAILINDNLFYTTAMTDNTYALIAVDTSTAGVRGLQVVGNSGFGVGTNRASYALAAQTQTGGAASNPTRIATLGSLFNSNNFYVANSAFYFTNSSPTVARGNMVTTNGTSYSAVADI